MNKINTKNKAIIIALTVWGLSLITSGTAMQTMIKPDIKVKEKAKIKIIQKRVASKKNNEIKLKDITQEINNPISVNIKDYLLNPEQIDNNVINQLKLDTSMVNTNQAGTYTYTITYKKKKYNGTFIVKNKENIIQNITLKNLEIKINTPLSADIKTYINETIPDEIINEFVLDISNVNVTKPGNYQYSITYSKKIYTASITIYEPQETITKTEKEEQEKTLKSTITDTNTQTDNNQKEETSN